MAAWDPFEEIRRIKREIDRMVSDFLGREIIYKPKRFVTKGVREPIVDIYEADDEVVVLAEMPGVRKEDISVSASEDAVEINAEVKKEERVEKAGYYRREREYTGFRRTISLPVKVDPKKTKASYKNGVLEIRLPKTEKKEKVKLKVE